MFAEFRAREVRGDVARREMVGLMAG